MKTAYEIAKKTSVDKILEEMRKETQKNIDNKMYEIRNELMDKPLPEEEDERDMSWHMYLLDLHNRLIFLRRKTLKKETFKDMDMEELNKLLMGC